MAPYSSGSEVSSSSDVVKDHLNTSFILHQAAGLRARCIALKTTNQEEKCTTVDCKLHTKGTVKTEDKLGLDKSIT